MTEQTKIPVPPQDEPEGAKPSLIERVVRNYDLVRLAPAPIPDHLVPPPSQRRRYRRADEPAEATAAPEPATSTARPCSTARRRDIAICCSGCPRPAKVALLVCTTMTRPPAVTTSRTTSS